MRASIWAMRWTTVLGASSLGFVLYCGGSSSTPGDGTDLGSSGGSGSSSDNGASSSGASSSGSGPDLGGTSSSGTGNSSSSGNRTSVDDTSDDGGSSTIKDASARPTDVAAPSGGDSPSSQFLPKVIGTCP